MDRAIVLLSGGIDSAVSLFLAREKGWKVYPLTFHYYIRPKKEMVAVRTLTRLCDCEERLIEVDLPFLKDVEDLLGEGLENPLLEVAPLPYVPARNLIFYSIAAHFGEVNGARWIVGGHNGADSVTFPDAGKGFFDSFNEIFDTALLTHRNLPLEVVNPLQGLSKAEVIRLGMELRVPLEKTWSCNWDNDEPCGECLSCRQRAEAFEEAGVEDPLILRLGKEGLNTGYP